MMITSIFRCSVEDQEVKYYYLLQLLGAILRAAFEMGMNVGRTFGNVNIYEALLQCKSDEKINAWFQQLYQKIDSYLEQRKNTKNASVADMIANYIRENYREELSLARLSQQVYMSVPYLSKIFREEKGCTIKQYINEVRMEKAKELLKNSKYKVSEVGKKSDMTRYMVF